MIVRVQTSPGVVLGHDSAVRWGSTVGVSSKLSVVIEAAAPTAAKAAASVQDDVDVQVLNERLCPVRHMLFVQVLGELLQLSVGPVASLRAKGAQEARGLRRLL